MSGQNLGIAIKHKGDTQKSVTFARDLLMSKVILYLVRSDSDKKLLRSKHGKTLKSFFFAQSSFLRYGLGAIFLRLPTCSNLRSAATPFLTKSIARK
jgi:hypothetical protein